VTITPIQPHEELPVEQPENHVQPRMSQSNFTSRIEIVRTVEHTDVPDQSQLYNTAISTNNMDGPLIDNTQSSAISTISEGNEDQTQPDSIDSHNTVTRAAEFPGGMAAWLNFLNRNLRVPDELQAGEQKKVVVRFLVSEEGNISKFEIVQSAGRVFDNEVIRVLKKMPKWKPAQQNGQNISVAFMQPVIFQAIED
jgi:protein TonB